MRSAIAHIHATQHRLTVFSGESGAGKTTLFRNEIVPKLRDSGWNVRTIEAYGGIRADLEDFVAENCGSKAIGSRVLTWLTILRRPELRQLLIFDQAEQLAHSDEAEWVRRAMGRILRAGVRVAIIVRKDHYYDLRFLKSLLPHVEDVFEVPGMPIEPRSADLGRIALTLARVATPAVSLRILEDLAGARSRAGSSLHDAFHVTPLEVQLIGTALEARVAQRGGRTFGISDYEEWGGTPSAIFRAFFADSVDAAPDPEAARLVLFATSVRRALRTSMTPGEICGATYLPWKVVTAQLRFFVGQNLLVRCGGAFEWAHEVLPVLYRSYASVEMPAGVRAVITDRVDSLSGIDHERKHAVRSAEEASGDTVAATIIVISLLTIIVVRLVLEVVLEKPVGPCSYLIVAPAHAAWGYSSITSRVTSSCA